MANFASTVRFVEHRIVCRIFVALWAMSLFALNLSEISASDIDANGYGLKVARIDTGSYSTQVIESESFGNRADVQFVRDPVCGFFENCATRHLTFDDNLPVSIFLDTSNPQPAARIWLWYRHSQQSVYQRLPGIMSHLATIAQLRSGGVKFIRA